MTPPVTYRCPRCGVTDTPPARTRVIAITHNCHPSGKPTPMIPVDPKDT